MQKSWRNDHDKLTFIICHAPLERQTTGEFTAEEYDAPGHMIGDINLFLAASEEDDDAAVGELELMIADKECRGKGLGRAALLALMEYLVSYSGQIMGEYDMAKQTTLKYLRVKIGQENRPSIRLFESVGFIKMSEDPNVFGELELRLPMANLPLALKRAAQSWPRGEYREVAYHRPVLH